MGSASFSCFSADFPGWEAGVVTGYILNDMMSVEVDANFGHINMLPQDFLIQQLYDVAGKGPYLRLNKTGFVHRYSARFNLNVLSFFPSLNETPWKAEFSPALSFVGHSGKYKFVRLSDQNLVSVKGRGGHFGYGFRLGAGYTLYNKYQLGVYAGYMQLAGGRLANAPKTSSCIVETGVRLTCHLGKSKYNAHGAHSGAYTLDVVLPDSLMAKNEVPVPEQPKVVLTVEQRKDVAVEGLKKYPDAVMSEVASFVDTMMSSATDFDDLSARMEWMKAQVLPDVREYAYMEKEVAQADSILAVLSMVREAEALLAQPLHRENVKAMNQELATLQTNVGFVIDKIESLRKLLNRYFLTTTWTLDIIERAEANKDLPDSSAAIQAVIKEYEDNGRLDMICEIPYMREVISQLIDSLPVSEEGVADWGKVAELKQIIENSRK